MDDHREVPPVGVCTRRRVLLASMTGALAVGVVGCASVESSAPDAGDSSASGAEPQILAHTGEVPVGGGVTVGSVVLVQPMVGTFKAFSIVCPHRGARVSAPDKGVMTCWEHNSTFRVDDGSRIDGPATRGLTQVPITVSGTDILTG